MPLEQMTATVIYQVDVICPECNQRFCRDNKSLMCFTSGCPNFHKQFVVEVPYDLTEIRLTSSAETTNL